MYLRWVLYLSSSIFIYLSIPCASLTSVGICSVCLGMRGSELGRLVRRFVRPSLRWGFILSVCLAAPTV